MRVSYHRALCVWSHNVVIICGRLIHADPDVVDAAGFIILDTFFDQ